VVRSDDPSPVGCGRSHPFDRWFSRSVDRRRGGRFGAPSGSGQRHSGTVLRQGVQSSAGLRPAPAPAPRGLRQRWSLPEVFDGTHDTLSIDEHPSRGAAARPLRDRLPSSEVRPPALTGASTGTESGGVTRQHLLYSFKEPSGANSQVTESL